MDNNSQLTRKKNRRRIRKGRVAIMAVVIMLITGLAVYGFFINDSSSKTSSIFSNSMKDKINILVLGVDEREDDVGRSDTAFVVTIDTTNKKVTMLSIPRDSRVKIAGHGWDKFNHAYAFGGSKLSKSTVENLLGISIDYTAVVSFNGFMRMIDAIGGVNIDVEKRMYYADPYDDNGGLCIDLQPGVQRMNGRTAIEYVRYRDEAGDIGRVSRQQKFLKALVQEFTKPQIITKLPELIKSFASAVKTDMPTREMVKLIPIAGDVAKAGLSTEAVNGTPVWIQEVSYWLPDIRDLRNKVAQIQGIPIDSKYTQETEQLALEYKNSVPREFKVADIPAEAYKYVAKPEAKESATKETKPKETTNSLSTAKTTAIVDPKMTSTTSHGQGSSSTAKTSNESSHSSGSQNQSGSKNNVVTDNPQ
ncbi:MAG: cell envelope-related transcriptional attenuator [Firmicutes bacterium]|nr:cell envelope-related transcriptional attenuator [Bacillota bacterium]